MSDCNYYDGILHWKIEMACLSSLLCGYFVVVLLNVFGGVLPFMGLNVKPQCFMYVLSHHDSKEGCCNMLSPRRMLALLHEEGLVS